MLRTTWEMTSTSKRTLQGRIGWIICSCMRLIPTCRRSERVVRGQYLLLRWIKPRWTCSSFRPFPTQCRSKTPSTRLSSPFLKAHRDAIAGTQITRQRHPGRQAGKKSRGIGRTRVSLHLAQVSSRDRAWSRGPPFRIQGTIKLWASSTSMWMPTLPPYNF